MDLGISRSHRPGEIPHAFCAVVWCGPANVAARGRRWIQSAVNAVSLAGFIHGLLFWDGDILLAYGLVGLICWRLVRDAPSVKSLFNTGVMLYLVGLGVLLLLGLISDSQTSRAWTSEHRLFCMKSTGNFTVVLKRSVIVPMVLATVYWHWAHSMAGNWQGEIIGAALMLQWLAERAVQLSSLSSYWFCAGGDWSDH